MGRRRRWGWLATGLAALLLGTTCSGAPRPEGDVVAGARGGSGRAGSSAADEGRGADQPAGMVDTATSPTDGGSGRGPGATGVVGPASATSTGAGAGDPSAPGEGGGGPQPFMADLYQPHEDRVGITDDRITLCTHAALALAQAFDTRPEDLNVYWDTVNDAGGVYGRRVEVSYEDDAYSPDVAVQAAQRCKQRNPFLLVGGIGFDQIPAVRAWAEANRTLYLHHIAVGAGGEDKRFSFTALPTVEDVGVAFGEYVVRHHRTKKIGVVYRQSENWQPGHDNGLRHMKANGVDVVADLPVQRNQGLYSQQIRALQVAGAELVWLWENALSAAQFIQQAHGQGYHPTFLVFPFQTTLDVVGDDSLRSPIEGVSTWSAYQPAGYDGRYAWPQFGYDAEIARFEAAYARYRSGVKLNDILWQVWMGNKLMHQMLLDCGPDCSRNRFAGLMLGGYQRNLDPACPVDFARHPHRGGYSYQTIEAYDTGQGPGFRTTGWCAEHL